MLDALREKKLGVRIMLLGLVVGFLGIGMVAAHLVPADAGTELTGADTVAEVGDQKITMTDNPGSVEQSFATRPDSGWPPAPLRAAGSRPAYFTGQPGIRSGPAGFAGCRSRSMLTCSARLVPHGLFGDTFIGMDRYTAEVQSRFQMDVPEFGLGSEKGIAPAEIPGPL